MTSVNPFSLGALTSGPPEEGGDLNEPRCSGEWPPLVMGLISREKEESELMEVDWASDDRGCFKAVVNSGSSMI